MISVIGTGKVGAAFAFLAAYSAIDDLVLVNRTKSKAVGEFFDIVNAIPPKSKISVTATDDMSEIKNSEVIVITASGGAMKDDRMDLLPFNTTIISSLAKNMKKYNSNSKVIVVTNPVDVLTYQLIQETGFDRNQVIGMGSSLDSSRFRYILAKSQNVDQSEIDAIVIGEHGPTMVPLFSLSRSLNKIIHLSEDKKSEITSELRNYWKNLHAYKGASVFGAAKHAFDIANAIVKNQELTVSASVYLDGEYGFHDMCMGVPVTINKDGAKIKEYQIDEIESDLLAISANRVKNGINKIITK